MSQTDKTRVQLAIIVFVLVSVVVPAIASAQPGGHVETSTSSAVRRAGQPAAYRTPSFWDGGEAAHLAYLAGVPEAGVRSARKPDRPPGREAQVVAGQTGGGTYTAPPGQPDWYAIAQCEAGGQWAINSGNGYWGGLQFAPSTWFAYGGGAFDGTGPFPYSAAEQIAVGSRVFAAQGPGAWPSCFRWA
jgi:hypothetical protein